MTLKGKIDNGKKLLHNGKEVLVKRMREKKHILSEEEINDICISSRFADIFTNVVECIGLEYLMHIGLIGGKLVDRLCGKDRKRVYVCSIYAGSASVIRVFESYLRGEQIGTEEIPEDKIARIGIYGFWNYFIECNPVSIELFKRDALRLSREKVADVIKERNEPSCSIASSLKQVNWKKQ